MTNQTFLILQVSDKLFDEINWLTVHSLKAVAVSLFYVHLYGSCQVNVGNVCL